MGGELMNKKKWRIVLTSILAFILVSAGILTGVSYIWADTNTVVKVLEITDRKQVAKNGAETLTSDLNALKNDSNYSVETISMKKFVALREELDGKYDVIYIGTGTYATTPVKPYKNNSQSAAHDTKDRMNDITDLKANEIINNFINKGQLVVLNNCIYNTSSDSKLKKNFGIYKTNPVSNVKIVSTAQEAVNAIQSGTLLYQSRPRFHMVNVPGDYLQGSTQVYTPGQTVQFGFRVDNFTSLSGSNLQANLYIDTDFNKKYDEGELMSSVPVTQPDGELDYTLLRGYSGLRYWKVEIVDKVSKRKDYTTGVFFFRDQKVQLKVLQVTKDSSQASSLKLSNNMNQTYLSNADYTIDITVIPMGNANGSDPNTFNNPSVYNSLNGKYNMLIFGFADVYNGANISNQAAQAVRNFIATGQGVMFTHDTIYQTNNNWVNNFMDITGQKDPRTDLGVGAPNTSTSTKKINDGMINQYPFKLSDNVQINTTHNQYYTLDLEDESVIPWYNIIGSGRDTDDSWNHYYTYSKGTVTYSGTGHTNTNFPSSEQQLFVNTMYRAFGGANHAPELTVYSPQDKNATGQNDKIRTIDPIDVVYKIEDLDLKDVFVSTVVTVKEVPTGKDESQVTEKQIYSADNVKNGSIIKVPQYTLSPEMKEGGKVVIKITAKDKQNATVEKIIEVDVKKVIAKLNLERPYTLNGEKDKAVDITYKVTPLDLEDVLKVQTMTVQNVVFSETLPPWLEVTLPQDAGWQKTGTLETGYTITRNMGNIVYNQTANGYTAAIPDPFTISVTPKKSQTYILGNAKLDYRDLDNQMVTGKFNSLILNAEIQVTKLEITPKTIEINVGESATLFAQLFPQGADTQNITWEWLSNVSYADKQEKNNGSVLITGLNPGKAVIKAKISTPRGEISDTAEINVVNPKQTLDLSRTVDKERIQPNEQATIHYSLATKSATEMTRVRPLVLEDSSTYHINDTLDLTSFKNSGNFGVIEFQGDVKQQLLNGYSGTVKVGDWLDLDNGNSNKNDVNDALGSLAGQIINICLVDQAQGTGSNMKAHVSRFATVRVLEDTSKKTNMAQLLGFGFTQAPQLTFTEVFPAGVSIVSVPPGFHTNGNTVTGTPNFNLADNLYKSNFDITVTSATPGTYDLNNSYITFDGSTPLQKETFNNLQLIVEEPFVTPHFRLESCVIGGVGYVKIIPDKDTIYDVTQWFGKTGNAGQAEMLDENGNPMCGYFPEHTIAVPLDGNSELTFTVTAETGSKSFTDQVIFKAADNIDLDLNRYIRFENISLPGGEQLLENRAVKLNIGYRAYGIPKGMSIHIDTAEYKVYVEETNILVGGGKLNIPQDGNIVINSSNGDNGESSPIYTTQMLKTSSGKSGKYTVRGIVTGTITLSRLGKQFEPDPTGKNSQDKMKVDQELGTFEIKAKATMK
jgi:hypothetical protein